jgi:hypothetical protein
MRNLLKAVQEEGCSIDGHLSLQMKRKGHHESSVPGC